MKLQDLDISFNEDNGTGVMFDNFNDDGAKVMNMTVKELYVLARRSADDILTTDSEADPIEQIEVTLRWLA